MTRRDLNTAAWQRTRRAFLNQWVARHGMTCAGYKRPPHKAQRLLADHVHPHSLDQGLQALCWSCNTAKGNKPPRPKPQNRSEIYREGR
jgi:5-methylcytosine-specific restriction endonuclease McrA